jgi:hypothetical protein
MSEAAVVDGIEAARSLRDLIAEEAVHSEESRTLSARTVEGLWQSGLMQWANPKAAGGSEPSLKEMIDTWIELAWQDGSVGWVGIANFPSAAVCAAYLMKASRKSSPNTKIVSRRGASSSPTDSGRP